MKYDYWERVKAFTSSADSVTLSGEADFLRLCAKGAGCHYSLTGVADTDAPYLPEDMVDLLPCKAPLSLSVIRASETDGILYITEIAMRSSGS